MRTTAWAAFSLQQGRRGWRNGATKSTSVFLLFVGWIEGRRDKQLAFLEVDPGSDLKLHLDRYGGADTQYSLHALSLAESLPHDILAISDGDSNVLIQVAVCQLWSDHVGFQDVVEIGRRAK